MTKKVRKRSLAIIVIVILLLITGIFTYRNLHMGYPPDKPDFQGFKPTVLPAGVSATGDELDRTIYRGQGYSWFTYGISFSKSDLRIIESKHDPTYSKDASCVGFGDPCKESVTAGGQHYIVYHGDNQGKPFDLTVEWVKDGTKIALSVDDKLIDTYLNYDWQPVIDGFKPVDLNTMKVQAREGHCCGG